MTLNFILEVETFDVWAFTSSDLSLSRRATSSF